MVERGIRKCQFGIGTRLLNGHGSGMEKLRRDGIRRRNGKIAVKDQNGKIGK